MEIKGGKRNRWKMILIIIKSPQLNLGSAHLDKVT
jgi:hypothetical protein